MQIGLEVSPQKINFLLLYFYWRKFVTWRSKKQNVVARSSAKAKFMAVAHDICKALWIKRLLEELKVTNSLLMKLYRDNKAAIAIAHNSLWQNETCGGRHAFYQRENR